MEHHHLRVTTLTLTLVLLFCAAPSLAATVSYLLKLDTFDLSPGVSIPRSFVDYHGGIAGPSLLGIQGTFIATTSDDSIFFENVDVKTVPFDIGYRSVLPAGLPFDGLHFSAGCQDVYFCYGQGFSGRFDGTNFFMQGAYSDHIIVDGISYTFEIYAHTVPLPSALILLISGLSMLGFKLRPWHR